MMNASLLRKRGFNRSILSIMTLSCLWFTCRAFSLQPLPHFSSQSPPVYQHSKSPSIRNSQQRLPLLTTIPRQDENENKPPGPFRRAAQKFRARPGTYLLIPCVASLVGWVTNWLAVQMIFYPIEFRGIPIYRRPEVPLGFLGWQGIIPCKTRPMSEAMVHMVSTQLLTVKEVFGRLDPRQVAHILAPEVPKLTKEIVQDVAPIRWMTGLPSAIYQGLDAASQRVLNHFNVKFLEQLTRSMQENIDSIFNLRNCVVNQMLQDRTKLGQLFRKCGQKELDFLTNSGLWFGFLLGIIQMVVALFWENPWSLSIGGLVVGYATNWLALKWIFEPVDPLRIGPITLQGQFLRRQKEVASEFSHFFANNILTSERLWHSVLNDPTTKPAFATLFATHFKSFVNRITHGFRVPLEPETLRLATNKAIEKLPDHVPVLYDYMDKTLGLEDTLRVRMEQMSSRQFERVLHPIFEEDELTLILAGAALGFAAGLIQQGLETGAIQFPDVWTPLRKSVVQLVKTPRQQTGLYLSQIRSFGKSVPKRIQSVPQAFKSIPKRIRDRLSDPFKAPNGAENTTKTGRTSSPSAESRTTSEDNTSSDLAKEEDRDSDDHRRKDDS